MAPRAGTTSARLVAVSRLRTELTGDVIAPADEAYPAARRVWNGTVDSHPAAIVRCRGERDVVAAVRTAREAGLPLSVRGGGHDWAGRAVRDGGVVVDLSGMRAARVDPGNAYAVAGGGARAGDLLAATAPFRLAPVTGTVGAVGVAGLTLGGGYGLLLGAYGLAADNLAGARVVLADGSLVDAGPADHPDLYWALRGGGGNFGVVTSLRYRLHRTGSVLAGLLLFGLAQATAVLRGYRQLIEQAPDGLTVLAGFFCGPDGVPLLFLLPAWVGDQATGTRLVARLAALGTPHSADVRPRSVQDLTRLLDPNVVDGRHNDLRTRWLPGLTDETIDLIVTAAAGITTPASAVFLHHFHGAATRVPVAATAFALRDEHLLVEIVAAWDADSAGDPDRHRQWAARLSDQLAPHAMPGGYPNMLGPGEHLRGIRSFGPNAPRLLTIKRRYDPDGVFDAVPSLRAPHESTVD